MSVLFGVTPAKGADRIIFSSLLGDLAISVASLETFAKAGKIDEELNFYAQFSSKEEMTSVYS